MNKRPVIKSDLLPWRRLPVWEVMILGLLLDRIKVPSWAWGVFGTVAVFWGFWALYNIAQQVECEVELKLPTAKLEWPKPPADPDVPHIQ